MYKVDVILHNDERRRQFFDNLQAFYSGALSGTWLYSAKAITIVEDNEPNIVWLEYTQPSDYHQEVRRHYLLPPTETIPNPYMISGMSFTDVDFAIRTTIGLFRSDDQSAEIACVLRGSRDHDFLYMRLR